MPGYFWKNKETKLWSWRTTKKSDDWNGGFTSRDSAKIARDEYVSRNKNKIFCFSV
jgi:hypothetical protein